MTTTFQKAELVRALDFAARATSRKSTMPILGCVLLDADGDAQRVTGTDLDVAAVAHVTPTEGAPITACIDARTLLAVVKALPDGDVTLSMDSALLVVSGGRARTKLGTLPASDYPKVPAVDVALSPVDAAAWTAALAATRDAVSHDETRHVLNAVCVSAGTWAATDGHRLHVAPGPSGDGPTVLLPRVGLAALDAVVAAGAASWGATASHVVAASAAGRVVARLVDGRFPDWRQVVPSQAPTWTLRVVAADLLAAIARVELATGASGMIRLDATGGTLALSAETPEGSARDEVTTEDATGTGRIACAGHYLRDAVRAVGGETVTLAATDEIAPMMVLGPDGDQGPRAVVMPMRM